jgi:hypothetical protein
MNVLQLTPTITGYWFTYAAREAPRWPGEVLHCGLCIGSNIAQRPSPLLQQFAKIHPSKLADGRKETPSSKQQLPLAQFGFLLIKIQYAGQLVRFPEQTCNRSFCLRRHDVSYLPLERTQRTFLVLSKSKELIYIFTVVTVDVGTVRSTERRRLA